MAGIVSGMAVLVTILFGYFNARRAQYERVLNVIDHISSADVAEARHRLGMIIYNPSDPIANQDARIQDLFIVLWAFNRIDAVRQTLPAWRLTKVIKLDGPHRLLENSTSDWARFWRDRYEEIAKRLGASVGNASKGLENLIDAWPENPQINHFLPDLSSSPK